MNWLLGAPVSVFAREPAPGHVQAVVEYEGATGIAEGSMRMPASYPFSSSIRVDCERGAAEYAFTAAPAEGGGNIGEAQGPPGLRLYPADGEPVTVPVESADPGGPRSRTLSSASRRAAIPRRARASRRARRYACRSPRIDRSPAGAPRQSDAASTTERERRRRVKPARTVFAKRLTREDAGDVRAGHGRRRDWRARAPRAGATPTIPAPAVANSSNMRRHGSVSAAGLALSPRTPGYASSPRRRVRRHYPPAGGTGGRLGALPLSADAARISSAYFTRRREVDPREGDQRPRLDELTEIVKNDSLSSATRSRAG